MASLSYMWVPSGTASRFLLCSSEDERRSRVAGLSACCRLLGFSGSMRTAEKELPDVIMWYVSADLVHAIVTCG